MTTFELRNAVLYNLKLLVEERSYASFTRNCYDRLNGYKLKHFTILNCLLLNPGVTLDVILLYYNLIDKSNEDASGCTGNEAPNETRTDTLSKMIMRIAALGKKNGKDEYISVFLKGYHHLKNVYCITKDGLDYFDELQRFLALPEGYQRFSMEELTALLSSYRRRSGFEHGIDCTEIMSRTALSGRFRAIFPVEKEVQKDERFVSVYGLRNDSLKVQTIFPDVVFSYASSNRYDDHSSMPIQPVIIEVDRDTERVSSGSTSLGDKLYKHLSYSDKIASALSGPLPSSIICVVSETSGQAKKAARKEKENGGIFTSTEANYIRYGKFQSTVMEAWVVARIFLDSDYDLTPCEDMINEYLTQLSEVRPEFVSVQKRYDAMRQICSKYEENTGEKLCPSGYSKLRALCLKSRSELGALARDERLSEKTRIKADQIDIYLNEKKQSIEELYLSGHSLCVVPMSRYTDYLPSLHPYTFGLRQVKALLKYLRLPAKWCGFYPSYPLLRSRKYEYGLILKNCFETDGVRVFIEDISADISSLSRIRDYVCAPSHLVRNSLLVIVIDDDLCVFGGKHISKISYTRGIYNSDHDGDLLYEDVFFRDYKAVDDVPLNFRKANDFMFVKRSEFLKAEIDEIHPFVVFSRGRIVMRTAEKESEGTIHYLDDVPVYHTSLHIPVTEFRAFDVKGEVKLLR